MSKYIKLEDAIEKCKTIAGAGYKWLSDLPTIEIDEDCINGFREGQKDMLMFLLEGMKNALEEARTVGENRTTEQSSIEIEDEEPIENLIDIIYPVGSCYFNHYGLANNPNDEFDNTTWEDCGSYWRRVK